LDEAIAHADGMAASLVVIQPPKRAEDGIKIPAFVFGKIAPLVKHERVRGFFGIERGVLHADSGKGGSEGAEIFFHFLKRKCPTRWRAEWIGFIIGNQWIERHFW
jgi:hypothetical protein